MSDNNKKNVVVIGAGPAGLSFCYEILKKSSEYNVIILEKTSSIGGISRTVYYNGNRMDIGGHRFFSKNEDIVKWWLSFLNIQNKDSFDDILLSICPSVSFRENNPISTSVR